MINYPGRAQSMVRKKFAGRGDGVDERRRSDCHGKLLALLFSFFLVHLRALVIL